MAKLQVGKIYRRKYQGYNDSKLLWNEVNLGKNHSKNQALVKNGEVFIFLGNETRKVTGSEYMTFLDGRAKVICFAAGTGDADFELVEKS